MAVSGKVYGKSDFSIGIVAKSGSAFSTAASASGAYKLLPVTNVSSPVLNLIESGEIRSNNAGLIELDQDQFRSTKGGFVTLDFEVPAERNFLVRLLANVLQDHTENTSGTNVIHTVQATSSAALSRPDFTSGSSAGTIVNSKAVVYGSSGEVNATTLQIAGTSITSTATELNILDGVTATTTELNYVDGVTSAIQTQLNTKASKGFATAMAIAL